MNIKDNLIKELREALEAVLPYAENEVQGLWQHFDCEDEAAKGSGIIGTAQKLLKGLDERVEKAHDDERWKTAGNYLCDDDVPIQEQVNSIEAHANGDDYIDRCPNVCVWERVKNKLSCDEFLNLIEP